MLERLLDDGLAAGVQPKGDILMDAHQARFGQHPHEGDIRGPDLFGAIEIVENRDTKALFDPTRKIKTKIKHAAIAEGLICSPAHGSIAGQRGNHVLLASPFILTNEQIDELTDKLARAVVPPSPHAPNPFLWRASR